MKKAKRLKKITKGNGIPRRRLEDPGQRRYLKAATKEDHKLRKNWSTRSLTVGSLHANIKRSLNGGDESEDTKNVRDAITEASDQVDTLCSILFEVVALEIDRIMGPKYHTESFSPAKNLTPAPSSTLLPVQGPPIWSSSVGSSSSAPPPAQRPPTAPLAPASPSAKAEQRVPYDVSTSSPIQLSQQERSDLMERKGTDPLVIFSRFVYMVLFHFILLSADQLFPATSLLFPYFNAVALDYTVVDVHEFYTSAKCPRLTAPFYIIRMCHVS